ncbi:MAG: DUF1214 domain-containing protein [Rhizobiaceae bacterium]
MTRTILLTLIVIATAVGGGAASVWYALEAQEGIGAVTIGGWTAFPAIGTPDADPYSKARVAREGLLALGHAEGLVFIAHADSRGDAMDRRCSYKVEGQTPPARFWTLYAGDLSQRVIPVEGHPAPAIQSQEVLRQPDNSFSIGFGPRAAPGNWVRVGGSGPFTLVLTLYDSPLASNPGFADVPLPQILRTGCND